MNPDPLLARLKALEGREDPGWQSGRLGHGWERELLGELISGVERLDEPMRHPHGARPLELCAARLAGEGFRALLAAGASVEGQGLSQSQRQREASRSSWPRWDPPLLFRISMMLRSGESSASAERCEMMLDLMERGCAMRASISGKELNFADCFLTPHDPRSPAVAVSCAPTESAERILAHPRFWPEPEPERARALAALCAIEERQFAQGSLGKAKLCESAFESARAFSMRDPQAQATLIGAACESMPSRGKIGAALAKSYPGSSAWGEPERARDFCRGLLRSDRPDDREARQEIWEALEAGGALSSPQHGAWRERPLFWMLCRAAQARHSANASYFSGASEPGAQREAEEARCWALGQRAQALGHDPLAPLPSGQKPWDSSGGFPPVSPQWLAWFEALELKAVSARECPAAALRPTRAL